MTTHAPETSGKVLLDAEALSRTLSRIAHEIIEANPELDEVALVVRSGEDDGGRAVTQLGRNGERVEQQKIVASFDRVRRDELRPPLLLIPVGMPRRPVPNAGLQLAHGGHPTSIRQGR